MEKTIVAGALGECVHVAGVLNFLRLAELAGWKTLFTGPASSIDEILRLAEQEKAALVGVSYRLTPETGERLLGDFAEAADCLRSQGVRFAFGGTPPVVERARRMGFFERTYDGNQSPDEILAYLKGQPIDKEDKIGYPQSTIERIRWKSPFPILRHHFGLPFLQETVQGVEKIAQSRLLDVISLGIDQDAQEHFFHPERQSLSRYGAGGVPVRRPEDFQQLYQASRCGNYPLMRTYSGSDDFVRMAEMALTTIQNAWCAVPLFWFNAMDGRGPWGLAGSIEEHQKLMAWYANRSIPVELNEPHHWGMRDAPDVVSVAAAYLSAYNARAFGVQDYIAQLMFNSPPGLSDAMDLAKMLAILEMIQPLAGPDFRIWRQTRSGLLSFPLNLPAARAQLAANIYVQMALKPHIVHVVAHCEADHAAAAEEVIEACEMAQHVIQNTLAGQPDLTLDPKVQERKDVLIAEAQITLNAIRALAPDWIEDPLIHPITLAKAVNTGILDAPQLKNNPFARGEIHTRTIQGACLAVDSNGKPIQERNRLAMFF